MVVFVCLAAACAQVPEAPELDRARQDAERLRALVEAGVVPRARLAEAQQALEEAQDAATLRRTLYGAVAVGDLSEQQAEEMLAAARRHLDRQQAAIEKARRLVEEGAASRASLAAFEEELARRQATLELAVARSNLFRELAAMVRAEQALEQALESSPEEAPRIAERYEGDGVFRVSQLKQIVLAFERRFARPLPVSARGATRLHRSLGFDHRDRVDVALNPASSEGRWLRRFLEAARIPYFAFRAVVPGRSTAPHIHIGPPSARLKSAD